MTHLGSRVAALVDGQLPPAEAESLLAHAAACPRCEDLLAQERASRWAVSQAADVRPDPELTARLLALSPGPEPHPRHPGRRRALLVGAGAGVLAGATAVGLVAVGSLSEPRTDPRTLLDAVNGQVGHRPAELREQLGAGAANADIVEWMEAHGWSAPHSLPDGMRVVDVEVHETDAGEVLEVELAGAMAHVRVLQQHGVLAEDLAADLQTGLIGHHDTVSLPTGVHDVALQSEDCVVVVVASADDAPAGDAVLAALPVGDYDTSIAARLVRGWDTVTQWLG